MTESSSSESGNADKSGADTTAKSISSLEQAKALLAEMNAQLALTKAASAATNEHQKQAAAYMAEAASILASAKTIASDAEALASKVAGSQETLTEQLVTAKESKDQAVSASNEIKAMHAKAVALAAELDTLKVKTQASADSANELLERTRDSSRISGEETAVITNSRIAAKQSEALLSDLSEKAKTVEERISNYEQRLAEFENQGKLQLETIVGLLPGATSAGLASAFEARGKTFMSPARRWQTVFVSSIVILVLLALSSLWHVYQASALLTYDELFRLWLARLPIAGALVWLALHASRESALAKRLEEDYGYKAAIASSFLGFNKQMSDLTEKAVPDSPIAKLCSDTLATIASPPGRIYDKHQLTVSPSSELTDTLKGAARLANEAKVSGI